MGEPTISNKRTIFHERTGKEVNVGSVQRLTLGPIPKDYIPPLLNILVTYSAVHITILYELLCTVLSTDRVSACNWSLSGKCLQCGRSQSYPRRKCFAVNYS